MISFLNSGILFLSSAILIPILIYLFAKRKPKRIIFSSIRFIKESQQKQKRKINLKNLLLLIIRILIVLFTILAIARPAIKSDLLKKGTDHPKTAIAVIIDNSYSMNYLVDTQTDLEKAKSIAHQLNEIFTENDNTIILTLNDNWNKLHSGINYGKLSDKLINEITISAHIMNLENVIKLAEKKLMETHLPNKEIYLITDMQVQELNIKLGFPTFFIPTSQNEDKNNVSCQNAVIKNEIVNKGLKKQLEIELVNHSKILQQDVIYKLFIDGNTVSERATDLHPEQRKKLTLPLEMNNPGWHYGYASVKNERLFFDNRSYFSFYLEPDPNVAIISDLEQIPVTLESILDIYTKNISVISTENVNYEILQNFENIIVYKKQKLSKKMISILNKLKKNNRKILFIADNNLSIEQQKYVSKLFSCDFQTFNSSSRNIDQINKFHPITKLMKNMNNIDLRDFWEVTSNSNILLRSNEFPLAIEHQNSVLWLFDVESIKNPFLLDPVFPVFAYNCLQFTSEHENISYEIGHKIQLDSPNVTLPDGTSITLKNNYFSPAKTGIYFNDNTVIAVNLDYTESKFERWKNLKIKNLKLLDSKWQDNILQSRYGFELWKYLLIAVLVLFILEMLIIKREERKKS
ncbi:MAG: BatA domain-containing protein [Candidatus Tenebribacter davisii]|nr:BatA domain-containing protein [Candidatus Tenebribacter davisii]